MTAEAVEQEQEEEHSRHPNMVVVESEDEEMAETATTTNTTTPQQPGAAASGAAAVPQIILADPEEWDAVPDNVRAVLESAGGALLAHVPNADLPPVLVRAKGGPIALFARTAEGHTEVRLNTGGQLWSQYAYQFSHEFCHLLCRGAGDGPEQRHNEHKAGNLWFEEALCETASLFALRRMAAAWAHAPPYNNWKEYAPCLHSYAAQHMAGSPRPEHVPLAEWFNLHREEVTREPIDRSLSLGVASALLPLFEAAPERWGAVRWLYADAPEGTRSFRDHLVAWRRHAPPEHARTIEAIAAVFGETLPPVEGDGDGGVDGAAAAAAAVMEDFDGLVRDCEAMKTRLRTALDDCGDLHARLLQLQVTTKEALARAEGGAGATL